MIKRVTILLTLTLFFGMGMGLSQSNSKIDSLITLMISDLNSKNTQKIPPTNDAELFLKYSYSETKDMCLHFLTLLIAFLVFSLNFSEKFYDFKNSTKRKRLIVITSWCLFILSIIFCGLGLVENSLAGGQAVSELNLNLDEHDGHIYDDFAHLSYGFIVSSGGLFILGLLFTIIAFISSRRTKKEETVN
jgi:hypothetical protein